MPGQEGDAPTGDGSHAHRRRRRTVDGVALEGRFVFQRGQPVQPGAADDRQVNVRKRVDPRQVAALLVVIHAVAVDVAVRHFERDVVGVDVRRRDDRGS